MSQHSSPSQPPSPAAPSAPPAKPEAASPARPHKDHRALIAGLAVFGVLTLVGGGLALWKYRSIQAAIAQGQQGFEPAEAVEIVVARTARWQPTAQLSGTVIALRSVTVSNEVAGVVTEVGFESGQVVEAGQVLLRLDASTDQADLRAAQAAVRVAQASAQVVQAQIALAETNVRRLTQAVAARAAADADLDSAKATLDQSRADLERAQASVDQAKAAVSQVEARLAKRTIVAPFRARAGLRSVQPGQYLGEGASVVTLQSVDDQIYLDFAVPQEQAQRVREGMRVQARGADGQEFMVEVVAMDASVNPGTRNVRIRSRVENLDQRLRPGMFVDVEVPAAEASTVVVVPGSAVRRASYGDHVFLVAPGEAPDKLRAKQRFIRTGPSMGSDVVVLEGVAEGDRIAGAGSFKLREGALVIEAPPANAPNGAPTGAPTGAPAPALAPAPAAEPASSSATSSK